jgi:hypothetical protein
MITREKNNYFEMALLVGFLAILAVAVVVNVA